MKALCVREPWASAIASGRKTIETRTWRTHYRGPLLIVGSKMKRDINGSTTRALCTCRLVDCRKMVDADIWQAGCANYPGAVAWVLEDVQPIKAFPLRGRLGLFDVKMLDE